MIEVLQDNVVIELIPLAALVEIEHKIKLSDRLVSDSHYGTVYLVGPDVKRLDVGNVVVVPNWNDGNLEVDGKNCIILAEKSISMRISE